MDEFNETTEIEDVFSGVTAETAAEREQEGTDTLAAAAQDMGGDGIDQGDGRIEVFVDLVFDSFQFASIGFPDISHGLNGRSRRAFFHPWILGQP